MRELLQPAADLLASAFDRDPHHVVAYRGYGTSERALVLGRALQDEGQTPPDPAHTRWRNFREALRRIESDPLPQARLRATIGDTVHELVADDEGYVERWLPVAQPFPTAGWHPVTLELIDQAATAPPASKAEILIPAASAAFGVISDLDDTVIQSEVLRLVRAARLVLLENARTRLPFPGVAAFYRALEAGTATKPAGNPIFYVSNSPWNLYGVIADFLTAQQVPAGPILLTDWDWGRPNRGGRTHKETTIGGILDAYPNLPFILVGDSGQEDPEIYGALVNKYGGRILAVYIRNVAPFPERLAAIRKLADEVTAAGSALVLADDTLAAARHAAERGWIPASALDAIGTDKRADEGKTGTKEPAPGAASPPPATPTIVVDEAAPRTGDPTGAAPPQKE